MKKQIKCFLAIALLIAVSSCDGYLGITPKGEKLLKTFADYDALLNNDEICHNVSVEEAVVLLNDQFIQPIYVGYFPYREANYLWNETADRIALNNESEDVYTNAYSSIAICNLIIEKVADATEAPENEKRTLIAQAKVVRAMNYFNLANYYADTYEQSTASDKLSVPLIMKANVGAAHHQATIQEIYDFMLNDLKEAIPDLTPKGSSPVHPTLGTAYAMYARIYLQMSKYEDALTYAEKALAENDKLYDWKAFYDQNKDIIDDPENYEVNAQSPMNFDYSENYIFRHGGTARASSENNLSIERASLFEPGDASFISRWKYRKLSGVTFYTSITSGYYNFGGITTTEVYLIKAECLARQHNYSKAMDALNAVREKRILTDNYSSREANSEIEAITYIRQTKDNALIGSIIPFADARRFNKESQYARTLTKEYKGQTLTLSPNSHLWTFPFPLKVTSNPGNGTITQNVNK